SGSSPSTSPSYLSPPSAIDEPPTSGATQMFAGTMWLTSIRTSYSAQGVGSCHWPGSTAARKARVDSSAPECMSGRFMARFHHAVAPGVTGAATVAGDDSPRDHREADRDHGEHRVHRLEGEVAGVVTPDVPDARDPDIDGPHAEGPEDEGFAAEHGATVAVASAALRLAAR